MRRLRKDLSLAFSFLSVQREAVWLGGGISSMGLGPAEEWVQIKHTAESISMQDVNYKLWAQKASPEGLTWTPPCLSVHLSYIFYIHLLKSLT